MVYRNIHYLSFLFYNMYCGPQWGGYSAYPKNFFQENKQYITFFYLKIVIFTTEKIVVYLVSACSERFPLPLGTWDGL